MRPMAEALRARLATAGATSLRDPRARTIPEEPTFVVIDDVDDPDEYSDFQDFAYDEFGLVDVMAFTYEPELGMEAVEDVLGLLREDLRMVEDPTVEL